MANSIYSSLRGREEILALYEQAIDELGVQVDRVSVDTRYGQTNVLVAGPEDAPPLVVFQGGNFLGPLSMGWFRPLMDRWRIYAPDTIGHPGKSAETRVSPADASYGEWAVDVLNGLGLTHVPIIGLSYGAGILLRLASIAPERIQQAVLLMPAGIIPPPILALMIRIVPPLLLYKLFPSQERLLRAVRPMFTTEPPEAWAEAIGAMFRQVRLESGMPRPVTSEEMSAFHSPMLLIAGEKDPFFPGELLLEKAERVLPASVLTMLLEGERHLLSAQGVDRAVKRIGEFLETTSSRSHGESTASQVPPMGPRATK